jgi:P4 family phage/plasmid primase-like protien
MKRHNPARGELNMNAPKILKDSPHWVLRKGIETVGISGSAISCDNPNTWLSYDEVTVAYEHAQGRFDGVGYILSDDEAPIEQFDGIIWEDRDPGDKVEEIAFVDDSTITEGEVDDDENPGKPWIICIELQYCRDPITFEVSKWAKCILRRLNSPSSINIAGTGFIAFCICSRSFDFKNIQVFSADDLSEAAKTNLMNLEPDVASRIAKGEPPFNMFKAYRDEPQFFAITGEWLEDYPLEMEDRTKELEEILCSWTPIEFQENTGLNFGDSTLLSLDVLKVIDTSGFMKVGDEFVGHNPLIPNESCAYLKVNPSSKVWYFLYEGREIMGDAWLWLAAESGTIDWKDIHPNVFSDPAKVQKIKEYAVSKGYFAEDDLFQETKKIHDALKTVADIKDATLSNPGLPFEPKNLEALALVKMNNMAEYVRIKAHWKGLVPIRDLEKAVDEEVRKIQVSSDNKQSPYIEWNEDKSPRLLVGTLVEDIIRDRHIHAISGTSKNLAIYNESKGTYDLSEAAYRIVLKEAQKRVRECGDFEFDTLGTSNISKIRQHVPAAAPEIEDAFETNNSLMCVGNGVVDLRTSELLPWSPDYFMVERTSVNYVSKDPWEAQAPLWCRVLDNVFDADDDRIEYFQRYIGYAATGETSQDTILILYGIGGTGKSTIVDIIREVLEGYAKVIKSDLQKGYSTSSMRDGIARAKYSRFLLVKELDKDNNLSWSTIKELTSTSSKIEARKMYQGTENMSMKSKIAFDTNFMPTADEPDRSITRRLKCIPFRHKFEDSEMQKRTFEYLKNEKEGILAWIIEGAKKWYESGLGDPSFLQEELSIYEMQMDKHLAVAWFNQSGYEVDLKTSIQSSDAWVYTLDLYDNYAKFATEGGVVPFSIEKFSEFMVSRGAKKGQKTRDEKRKVYWLNLKKK